MKKRVNFFVALVALLTFSFVFAENLHKYDMNLTVHFIDVGHGDCIFITTPNDTIDGNGKCEGYKILIDAGKQGRGRQYVIPYLNNLGMKQDDTIDYVVITHAHEDHIGGMSAIYKKYQINNTIDPGYEYSSTIYGNLKELAWDEAGSKYWFDPIDSGLIDSLGDFINLGNELKAQILYYSPTLKKNNINNTSIVLRIQYGDESFLFMGDAEKYVEKTLIKRYGNELKSTVLKVGHHGSKTASSSEFLNKVKPEYAVILAGRGVFSGTYLPNDEVIQELEDHNIHVLRTDYEDENKKEAEAGGDDNIIMTTDGTQLHVQADQ